MSNLEYRTNVGDLIAIKENRIIVIPREMERGGMELFHDVTVRQPYVIC